MRIPGDSEARIAVAIVVAALLLGVVILFLPAWALPMMILVHTVDERDIALNADHIVSITEPRAQMTDDAHCMIAMVDGKFVSTRETCREVGMKLQHEDAKEK